MDDKTKYYLKLADEFLNTEISLTKMADREKTTRQTLSKKFKELGIEIINKQNATKFDETVFDVIDTEEKAYWLGFIFADGSIRSIEGQIKPKYTLEVSLKGLDIEHLRKFNKFMKASKEIKITKSKCGNKEFDRYRWIITNKHLWNTLYKLGCTSNKSLSLEFPENNIFRDTSLIRHFIRGYFDGDGCISRHINVNTVTPLISLVGTESFLVGVLDFCQIEASFRHDKRHSEYTYSIEFNKNNGILFINYLYENSTIYLDRKYKLYNFFKNGSRSVKEFTELLSGNIGGTPAMDNTEIIEEIKESSAS